MGLMSYKDDTGGASDDDSENPAPQPELLAPAALLLPLGLPHHHHHYYSHHPYDDHHGGHNVCCFKSGTRILTARGEVPVEDLRVGDAIKTLGGGEAPATWIGWRKFNLRAMREPGEAAPVRIARNALADGTPRRDLYVSQEHAVFLDGVLIPARSLINGRTIMLSLAFPEVTYYHVELDVHGVVFAEGAAAESFLESGNNRALFANQPGAVLLRSGLAGQSGSPVSSEQQGWRRLTGYAARAFSLAQRAAAMAGARPVGELARVLNERALRHCLGACAIRSSEGPLVDDVRRRLEARADELETASLANTERRCA
jgi:hypothetical protein